MSLLLAFCFKPCYQLYSFELPCIALYVPTLAEYSMYSPLLSKPFAQKVKLKTTLMRSIARRAVPPVDCLWCYGSLPLS